MGFSNNIYEYSGVRVEAAAFSSVEGAVEYHVMLHVINTGDSFERQLKSIRAACFYVQSHYGHEVRPVFKRYFISDASNQAEMVSQGEMSYPPCAVSVVQQPPLDGSKVAMWLYLVSDAECAGTKYGVEFSRGGYTHLWRSGEFFNSGDSHEQTSELLKSYEKYLSEKGCDVEANCVRTWFYVQNVDVNYAGLVASRRAIFEEWGMTENTHYIASTGIEGRHADHNVSVMMDAYAVGGLKEGQQRYLSALTHLNPTHEYGVTFERGVSVEYGERRHIYISGTASIDNKGDIVAVGDIARQTERTLENIDALLAQADASGEDVAQMIVYLRDVGDYGVVKGIVEERFPLTPKVITLAPVCRPGWLIEIECIAIKECVNPQYEKF